MSAAYTKVPNAILDSMSNLKPASFKLAMALCRLTYGYHRESVKVSISDLQELTGLSHQGVINAAKDIKHLFSKEKDGQDNVWLVNRFDQYQSTDLTSDDSTSQQSLLDQSTDLTSTSQQSLPVTSGLKKKKENIKEKAAGAASPTGDVFTAFEQNISNLTPIVAERVGDLVDEYGETAVMRAITEAASSNGRTVKYIESILRRWGKSGAPSENQQPPASDPYQTALAHAARGDPNFTDETLKTAVRLFGWPRLQAIKPGNENFYRAEFMRIFNEQQQRIQQRA